MKKFIKNIFLVLTLLFITSVANAQVILASFEDGLKPETKFVDSWQDSPFNNGTCVNVVSAIENPFVNDINSSEKVLHYKRPYYAGDRNGVEIKLEKTFTLTPSYQYIHVFVHKPISSNLVLVCVDKNNGMHHTLALSQSESKANTWSDAVFKVSASGYEIDRLIVYPDLATSVQRLEGDNDIYIDEIMISNSDEPRSVTDYCNIGGVKAIDRYVSNITTVGASLNLNHDLSAAPNAYVKFSKSAIVAEPGSPFTLKLVQSSTGDNTPWIVDVYADWNADKEFVSEGEYVGRATSVTNGNMVEHTIQVVPSVGTPVSSCALRVRLTDNTDPMKTTPLVATCENVVDGYVFNLPVEIAYSNDKPIVSIQGMNDQAGWGSIRFDGIDGSEVKVASGTNITVIATPNAGYEFIGWYSNITGGIMNESPAFSFSAEYNMVLVAKFKEMIYCEPTGELPVEAFFSKVAISPSNSNNLYYVGNATTDVVERDVNYSLNTVMGGVNVKRGTTAVLKVNAQQIPSGYNVYIWADWNKDSNFSSTEFIVNRAVADGENTFDIDVPITAISGNTRIRVVLSKQTLTGIDACAFINKGTAYDLVVTVTPNDNERFYIKATPSIAGAATFALNPAPGEDGKYPAGTNVEITCNTGEKYEFVQWLKDGMPYGATMTSNNPLPLTALVQDLDLVMKVESKFPTYCDGTAPNNSDGYHYGISSGKVLVNSAEAFQFSLIDGAIADLSATCIASVCAGDTIKIFSNGGAPHSSWAKAIAYIDWNMDGVWSTNSDEAYDMFDNPGSVITNHKTEIIVPASVGNGTFGIRLCSGEAPAHNSLGGGPCQARKRGTLFTFRVNSTALPTGEPKLNMTVGIGCTVEVRNNEGVSIPNKGNLVAGETYELTVAMTSESYMFISAAANGDMIEMTEQTNGTFKGSFTAGPSGARLTIITNEMEYCTSNATIPRADRIVNSVSFSGGTFNGTSQSFNFNSFGRGIGRELYEDHTDQVINCTVGDIITPVINYSGSWMHKYVYVDWGKDYLFDVGEAGDWKDLVSFNYVNGKNSAGSTTSNSGDGALGSFIIPETYNGQPVVGTYRLRFKIDWDNTDACGCFVQGNEINSNGGILADFTVNVDNKTVGIEDNNVNNIVFAGGNGVINMYNITETGDVTIYDVTGQMIKSIKVSDDTKSIEMIAGIYVVQYTSMTTSINAKVVVK